MKILKFITRWFLRLLAFALVGLYLAFIGVVVRNSVQTIGITEFIYGLLYVFGIIAVLFLITFGLVSLYVWAKK